MHLTSISMPKKAVVAETDKSSMRDIGDFIGAIADAWDVFFAFISGIVIAKR